MYTENWTGNIGAEVNSLMCPEMYCRKLCEVKADPGHRKSFCAFITCCARVLTGQTVSVMLFFPYAGCHSFKILPILGERDCKIALEGMAGCGGKQQQQLVVAVLGEAEGH